MVSTPVDLKEVVVYQQQEDDAVLEDNEEKPDFGLGLSEEEEGTIIEEKKMEV